MKLSASSWEFVTVGRQAGMQMMYARIFLVFIAAASILATSSCSAVDPSPKGLTGSFVANRIPEEVYLLELVQSGNKISGYMQGAEIDNDEVTITRLAVEGSVSADAIVLNASAPPFNIQSYTIVGRRVNSGIILNFPNRSGRIEAVTFAAAPVNTFNEAVDALRQISKRRIQATQQARAIAEDRERNDQKIKDLAGQLNASISVIIDSTKRIKDQLGYLRERLDGEQSAIQELQSVLEEEKREADVRPMTCYQALGVVGHLYNGKMAYYYNGRLGYYRALFAAKLKELESELSEVETRTERAQGIAQTLEQAMKSSPYPLPDLTRRGLLTRYSTPGDEKGPVADYRAAADAAREELRQLQAADADLLETADRVMAEGKTVLESAQAICKP